MKNSLPNSLCTIMAEDLRREADGRITIVGAYVGDDIVLPAGELPGKQLSKLCFVNIFRGGQGEFDTAFKIIAPNGDMLAEASGRKATKKLETNFLLNIVLPGFPVPEFGDYKALFYLDGHEYEFCFSVVRADKRNGLQDA